MVVNVEAEWGGNPELAGLNGREVAVECIVLLYSSCFHSDVRANLTIRFIFHFLNTSFV